MTTNKRKKIYENLFNFLNKYSSENDPLTKTAINRLSLDEVRYSYQVLVNPRYRKIIDPKTDKPYERPISPVKSPNHKGAARMDFKEGMNNYLSQWGLKHEHPVHLVSSYLEAAANLCEEKAPIQEKVVNDVSIDNLVLRKLNSNKIYDKKNLNIIFIFI